MRIEESDNVLYGLVQYGLDKKFVYANFTYVCEILLQEARLKGPKSIYETTKKVFDSFYNSPFHTPKYIKTFTNRLFKCCRTEKLVKLSEWPDDCMPAKVKKLINQVIFIKLLKKIDKILNPVQRDSFLNALNGVLQLVNDDSQEYDFPRINKTMERVFLIAYTPETLKLSKFSQAIFDQTCLLGKLRDNTIGQSPREKAINLMNHYFQAKSRLEGHDNTIEVLDIPDGENEITYSDGFYKGNWLNGLKHGYGVEEHIFEGKKEFYQGHWQNGLKHDQKGQYISNADCYEGAFVNGVRTGLGKYVWANGDCYEGEFINNVLEGQGTFTWANGDFYTGKFSKGIRNGFGELNTQKKFYIGYWLNNQKRDSCGVCIWTNGDRYEGTFIRGKRTGQGKFTWANGNVYEGTFHKGKQSGYGKFTWANGDVSEGTFLNGEQIGHGKYTWANGMTFEGVFTDEGNGFGKQTLRNGDIYEGGFDRGERSGKGKYTGRNGVVWEGTFKNGVLNGLGKMANPDGLVEEGIFKDGRLLSTLRKREQLLMGDISKFL